MYQSPLKFFDDKGRQFLGGSADVFFENKFQRIFEGEALTEPWRDEVKERVFIVNIMYMCVVLS